MAIHRYKAKLPHTPRLILERLTNLSTCRKDRLVERIDVVNFQICEIGMVTELGGRNGIGTLPRHDRAVAGRIEAPPGVWYGMNCEAENVSVECSRHFQIWNGNDKA